MNYIFGNRNRISGNVDNLHAIGCDDQEFDSTHSDTVVLRNSSVVIKDTEITHNVPLKNTIYEITSSTTVSVTAGKKYFYTGLSDGTFIMPTVSNNEGTETLIYNKSSYQITLNSNISGYDFYYNGTAVNQILIFPGESLTMFNDSVHYSASGIKKPRIFISASAPTYFETDDIWITP